MVVAVRPHERLVDSAKKRAVRRATPDEVGSQPLHAVMKRPSDKHHNSLVRSKKERADHRDHSPRRQHGSKLSAASRNR